ncbi:hypothetical protein FJV41_30885 [Myxococcus llanfairpwllgwyngyllgogerychwyrndrobwllllantysiliogogogochensis]|uniref:Lipoprotein n=1 Tax=Myxococcus llanfairpwllgwyngyllgogerychwyrndrobwllllantysiliogogogochensis TaxID=2590453 RepID=A0A540WSX3_9BACT|nr:S28 family serine protease [Myxococcus llanfairpwllgwyngyllgogerychwyrndrobwllllantysiliogogogochensis]TQF12093.1 hypothetical protein FJV41_30885 [Myxococcus llanfairpwllgwyngyllgogerychwyrndrobwllllantysiliogogogochensis]
MKKTGGFRAAWLLFAAVVSQACGGAEPVEPGVVEPPAREVGVLERGAESDDILERLRAMPDVVVASEKVSPFPNTRFFTLWFAQPVDHRAQDGEWFWLRATLLHRSFDAPTVVYGTGYAIRTTPGQSEPTMLLDANQLSVEQRFFSSSRPESADWTKLDIEQTAGDYHRIIQAFKPMYPRRWLTTGASKGGMSAVYHRYFYPDDVDATVAYVAPSLHGLKDKRFVRFLDQVGSEACRARLRDFQQDALRRREELLSVLESYGMEFTLLGMDRALEFAIVESSFYFWMYERESRCDTVPLPGAPANEMLDFVGNVTHMDVSYADSGVLYYAPYYYQSATELGWNRFPTKHLRGLLSYPRQDVPATYLSFPVQVPFSQGLMRDVERWVRQQGERMLFIYGETDPWSAGAFEVRERNDSFRFTAPNTNHEDAFIGLLAAPERAQALSRLYAWMDAKPPPEGVSVLTSTGLEEVAPLVDGRPPL